MWIGRRLAPDEAIAGYHTGNALPYVLWRKSDQNVKLKLQISILAVLRYSVSVDNL